MGKKNKVAFILCLIVFIGAVTFCGGYYFTQKSREAVYDEVAEKYFGGDEVQAAVSEAPTATPTPLPTATPVPLVNIPVKFDELKELNPEIYGWIHVEGANIDYPIVQRPEDDTYYLNHTIEGAEGLPGSIFTESLNKQDFSDPVTVVYGHNMKDGTMFGGLKKYLDSTYMEEHKEMKLYTEEHILTYQVFAAVTYDNRHILHSFDFSKEEGVEEFLESLQEARSFKCLFDDTVEVSGEDRLLVLSTCNSNNDQRFLIGAVLTDEE